MGFKLAITRTTQTEGKSDVDWDALNEHVIAAAGTAKKARSIPGVITGIYDLGEQNREDAEFEFNGDAAAEAKEIEAKPDTYFKDGYNGQNKPCRLKCYPQKPVQQCAIAVDFPQIVVDKGQFFGKSNPMPLRLLLNGEFSISGGTRIVGRPFSVIEKKYDDNTWAFAPNNGLAKLATACEILDDKGRFTKERIGELLGKVALFEFRVFMKPSKKDSSKSYFTESIKLSGMVPEGLPIPEFSDELLHGINVSADNDEEALGQLRLSVRNTIKRANNYEGSVIEQEFIALEASRGGYSSDSSGGSSSNSSSNDEGDASKPEGAGAEASDDEEDDGPF